MFSTQEKTPQLSHVRDWLQQFGHNETALMSDDKVLGSASLSCWMRTRSSLSTERHCSVFLNSKTISPRTLLNARRRRHVEMLREGGLTQTVATALEVVLTKISFMPCSMRIPKTLGRRFHWPHGATGAFYIVRSSI